MYTPQPSQTPPIAPCPPPPNRSAWLALLFTLTTLGLGLAATPDAIAKGGTAKPAPAPAPGATGPRKAVITPVPPAVAPVAFTGGTAADLHGFDVTGFLQSATVESTNCPTLPQRQWGGTAVVNGLSIVIPCNTTLQMPAATYTWAEMLDTSTFPQGLAIGGGGATPAYFPTTEFSIVGNIVQGRYIAGLVTVSQQSLNGSTGYIRRIDYATGALIVSASPTGPEMARLVINDPNGRFGRAQSPDARFSVDDENPTIKSAGSGYPMCVPRTTADPHLAGNADDPLCPQKNRPLAVNGCRNFLNAGVVSPAGWELSAPRAGQVYCSAFVMKAPPGTGTTATLTAAQIAAATEPDARQQTPFEVGDFITYGGTLLKGDGLGPNGSDTISVHTIDANVGVYTQPGTLPVYMSIGEFGVGADAPATAANGAPQEAANRLFLEASISDVTSVLDVYLVDVNPATGVETNRWITTEAMTGGITPGTQPFLGGITTQLIGPQPGRARVRATKAPTGVLVSPTRMIRVVARSLCAPDSFVDTDGTQYHGVNTGGAPIPRNLLTGSSTTAPCLERAPAANGLFTGQYAAPTFEYIFPENVVSGDNPVPYNFWDLGFLVNGEGPGTGPLIPKPW